VVCVFFWTEKKEEKSGTGRISCVKKIGGETEEKDSYPRQEKRREKGIFVANIGFCCAFVVKFFGGT